jgi:hypothetical protein
MANGLAIGMEEVTVDKEDLLTRLRANRDAHRTIFSEAVVGYRDAVITALERHLDEVKNGTVRTITVNLPEPEDHTKDYDRIITMCEMNVKDQITLTQDEFAQYVMDDWRWKRQFLASNSAYSQTARSQL